MGIRFTCVNGHKLNVKSYLAGRQGLCPYCGVPVDIPMQSTRESRRHSRESGHGEVPVPPEPEQFSQIQPSEEPMAPSGMAESAATEPAVTEPAVTEPAATPAVWSESDAPTARTEPSEEKPDDAVTEQVTAILAERPSAVWYLHQGDAQRGPYFMDSMQEFLRSGQISSDALLWREDWPDWREVLEVFPMLFPEETAAVSVGPSVTATAPATSVPAQMATMSSILQGASSAGGTPAPNVTTTVQNGPRSGFPMNGITALVIFLGSLLLLSIGIAWMLTRESAEPAKEAPEAVVEASTE